MGDRYSCLLQNPQGVIKTPLAGDASGRIYARWSHSEFPPLIHMDSQNDRPASCDDFIKIAHHLSGLGISAPKIFARSGNELLIEDLGDNLFSKVLLNNDTMEDTLYLSAVDLLLQAQQNPAPPNLKHFNAIEMAQAVTPAFTWYQRGATGEANQAHTAEAISLIEGALKKSWSQSDVMILRDYHADNLLWLPSRHGVARCGVLDFQDALLGHVAYDMASLLEDARRDVCEKSRQNAIAHFVEKSGLNSAEFEIGFSTQAAQRNLRILGVLSRLAIKNGKTRYLDFLPRVWAHLMRDLAHPDLIHIQSLITETLPAPTPAVIEKLGGYSA